MWHQEDFQSQVVGRAIWNLPNWLIFLFILQSHLWSGLLTLRDRQHDFGGQVSRRHIKFGCNAEKEVISPFYPAPEVEGSNTGTLALDKSRSTVAAVKPGLETNLILHTIYPIKYGLKAHWHLGNLNESSLAPGKFEWNFRYVNFPKDFSDWWLRHLLWNCPDMNVNWLHWWSVNIGSGNGLVPSGNKPLPESMLTQISDVIWRH